MIYGTQIEYMLDRMRVEIKKAAGKAVWY